MIFVLTKPFIFLLAYCFKLSFQQLIYISKRLIFLLKDYLVYSVLFECELILMYN